MNRKNLEKLATYLEALPLGYDHFHMARYIMTDDFGQPDAYTLQKYALKNGGLAQFECHTVACALGHGPAAGILMNENHIAYNQPMWSHYSTLFFHLAESDEWDWCFSGDWQDFDNTHRGAAARIRYMLANGLPEEFLDSNNQPTASDVETYEEYLHA